jgi:hypothetical protein
MLPLAAAKVARSVSIGNSYGNERYELGAKPVPENGTTWSLTLNTGAAGLPPFDGVFTVTASLDGTSAFATETFIVAEHETAFEAVGLVFNDVNQQLVSEPFILSISQELVAEKAGLQTLLEYDNFPGKPVNKLIDDISREEKALNFTPQNVGYADPHTIAIIEHIQQKMAALVHDTPALAALQPDGVGWTSPVDPSPIVGVISSTLVASHSRMNHGSGDAA